MAAETAAAPASTRQPISLWALAALLCAIVSLCPIAPVLGLVLGTVAMFDVRRPNRSGKRLAVTALVVSVFALGGWAWIGVLWNTHVRQPLLYGPAEAIAAGQRGDIAAFRDAFLPDAPGAPGAEMSDAIEFITTVSDRYGRLVGSSQHADADKPATTLRRAAISYEFLFETGPVDVEAEFVLSRDDGSGLVLRFAWVVVRDPIAGDVRYPP